ncbi:LysR family transcriptional regulator [Pantoea sp. NPDC088449]|uniref:LysR family transcriptional regulator n=1 Tax=Pantoea sp. NPDC088449 TaxID=3364392 RepID=UPI0037FECA7C
MSALRYSFSQIEAFAMIAETGSVSKAAQLLGKDRTTVRDLLDYLEDALGYTLFFREGRRLRLTDNGQQLHRQAHLFLRQAQAFESFARGLPAAVEEELVLVYDPFVPHAFLRALIEHMAANKIRFSAWSGTRDEAERALKNGQAHVAICQAQHRTLGNEMEWQALGTVELNFYAARGLFNDQPQPVTLLNLSLVPQLVMHHVSDEQVSRRLQISGKSLFVNDRAILQQLLERGAGWGFLPTHFQAQQWHDVQILCTEVGNQGLNITMVTLWNPGGNKNAVAQAFIASLPEIWRSIYSSSRSFAAR